MQGSLLHRVNETDVPGHQGDAAVPVGARRPVFEVSLDDGPVSCQLASDLVMAACQEFHLDQPVSFGRAQNSVPEFCQPGIFPAFRMSADEALVHLLVPDQPVLQKG